jgi:hypothetical protein
MVRAQARALALSVIPGNRRRSSMAADSSPSSLKMARIAAASASVMRNMEGSMVTQAAAGKPIPVLLEFWPAISTTREKRIYGGWENSCAVFQLPSRGLAVFHSP